MGSTWRRKGAARRNRLSPPFAPHSKAYHSIQSKKPYRKTLHTARPKPRPPHSQAVTIHLPGSVKLHTLGFALGHRSLGLAGPTAEAVPAVVGHCRHTQGNQSSAFVLATSSMRVARGLRTALLEALVKVAHAQDREDPGHDNHQERHDAKDGQGFCGIRHVSLRCVGTYAACATRGSSLFAVSYRLPS